jgi:hypothetical protein
LLPQIQLRLLVGGSRHEGDKLTNEGLAPESNAIAEYQTRQHAFSAQRSAVVQIGSVPDENSTTPQHCTGSIKIARYKKMPTRL